MIRHLLLTILVSQLWGLQPSSASAPEDLDRLNIYIAAGTAWTFPGSIRIGTRKIEGGLIAPGIAGAVYNIWDDRISASLGVGAAGLGSSIGYGIMTALGFQTHLIWIFKVRGEVFAFASHNGWVLGGAQMGLNLTF